MPDSSVPRKQGKRPLVARFGGVSISRNRNAVLEDQRPQRYMNSRNEIIKRLLADKCELCESAKDVEVHHIRHYAT